MAPTARGEQRKLIAVTAPTSIWGGEQALAYRDIHLEIDHSFFLVLAAQGAYQWMGSPIPWIPVDVRPSRRIDFKLTGVVTIALRLTYSPHNIRLMTI